MEDLFTRIQTHLENYKKSDSPDNTALISELKTEYDISTRLDRGDNLVPDAAEYVKSTAVIRRYGRYIINYDWPADDGFADMPKPTALESGNAFDRLGSPYWGTFVCPIHEGKITGCDERSVPYYFMENAVENEPSYHRYRVVRNFSELTDVLDAQDPKGKFASYRDQYCGKAEKPNAEIGIIAPSFGKVGGGEQIKLPMPIDLLLDLGMIEEI